jgi:hypothetical protein
VPRLFRRLLHACRARDRRAVEQRLEEQELVAGDDRAALGGVRRQVDAGVPHDLQAEALGGRHGGRALLLLVLVDVAPPPGHGGGLLELGGGREALQAVGAVVGRQA